MEPSADLDLFKLMEALEGSYGDLNHRKMENDTG